ncbi:MAG: DUF2892 domain-containing protein [Bacteroidales bacterium]|nr:DUF2892 domain-containing protein [Bacteroidales bacterium]
MNAFGMLSLLQKAMLVAPDKQNVGTTDRIFSSAAGILLGYTGIRNFKRGGFALLLPAGYLLIRGTRGYCQFYNMAGFSTIPNSEPFEFNKSLTIHRNRIEVYNFWRRLENLPLIMKHIKNVEKVTEGKYYWEAEFNNRTFKWNAEVIEDMPNERISWTTTDASDIRNTGTVEFYDAPRNKGTVMRVTMVYTPERTRVGKMIARFLDPFFSQMIKDDLKRFKHMMESDDITADKSKKIKQEKYKEKF